MAQPVHLECMPPVVVNCSVVRRRGDDSVDLVVQELAELRGVTENRFGPSVTALTELRRRVESSRKRLSKESERVHNPARLFPFLHPGRDLKARDWHRICV